jgi:hypothetical protein
MSAKSEVQAGEKLFRLVLLEEGCCWPQTSSKYLVVDCVVNYLTPLKVVVHCKGYLHEQWKKPATRRGTARIRNSPIVVARQGFHCSRKQTKVFLINCRWQTIRWRKAVPWPISSLWRRQLFSCHYENWSHSDRSHGVGRSDLQFEPIWYSHHLFTCKGLTQKYNQREIEFL